MKTLIITEKPKVSQKVAYSISADYERMRMGGVSYYRIQENGDEILVASAAGHLYTLSQKRAGFEYPAFDVVWQPLSKVDRSKAYTNRYISTLKRLGSSVDQYIIATDWDIEGELLGYNALKYACLGGDVSGREFKRMRFSTLTRGDLQKAYRNLSSVDYGLVDAGEARHVMDWYWGINSSRALVQAMKKAANRFVNLSAGRVQTPALAILVKREREIRDFKPEKYWEVFAHLEAEGGEIRARHVEGRIFQEERAEAILEGTRGHDATLREVQRREVKNLAPPPFDLGALQSEAYRIYGLLPKKTQDLAQNLYEGGFISYPRTSSQKLPYNLGFKRIIEKLGASRAFERYSRMLLEKDRLRPRQGKKTDPAHPAIYPTGILPKGLRGEAKKLYELIVHRFFAVFADPVIREETDVVCHIGGEAFTFGGARTLEEGWMVFYPFISFKEVALPPLQEGDVLKVERVYKKEGQTKPPKPFNPSSLVKELERRGLGTKATRADTVEVLFRRKYVEGNPITVTELGFSVIGALEEYVPEIISEELTRRFEEKLKNIQEGKEKKETVLEEARRELSRILDKFKAQELNIGEKLSKALKLQEKNLFVVGECPACGKDLKIIRSNKTHKQFIGCSGFPDCKVSYPLPQIKGVLATDKKCYSCGLPMVSIPLGRRRVLSCIDMNCKSKNR
jgi:DNA topoisomerase-1